MTNETTNDEPTGSEVITDPSPQATGTFAATAVAVRLILPQSLDDDRAQAAVDRFLEMLAQHCQMLQDAVRRDVDDARVETQL